MCKLDGEANTRVYSIRSIVSSITICTEVAIQAKFMPGKDINLKPRTGVTNQR